MFNNAINMLGSDSSPGVPLIFVFPLTFLRVEMITYNSKIYRILFSIFNSKGKMKYGHADQILEKKNRMQP